MSHDITDHSHIDKINVNSINSDIIKDNSIFNEHQNTNTIDQQWIIDCDQWNLNDIYDEQYVNTHDLNSILDSSNESNDTSIFPCLKAFRAKHIKNFIMAHLNINWLHTKLDEVKSILVNNYVDLFALSETKLNNTHTKAMLRIEGFSLYRSDRPNNKGGGGVVCYVNSAIPNRQVPEYEFNQDGIQSVIVELIMKKEKWYVIAVYRPPNVSVQYLSNALDHMCKLCQVKGNAIYVLGDINVDFLKDVNPLKDTLDIYNLVNKVKGPTCYKNPNNPSSVDVFLSNQPKKVLDCINECIGVSDHHNIIVAATRMHAPKQSAKQITYRSYKNFNEEAYIKDLECTPFHVGEIFDDVEDQLWYHNKLLIEVMDKHAPQKKRMTKSRQLACMNGELRKAINVKAMLKRKFNRNRSSQSFDRYRNQRNKVTSLKRKSLKEYLGKNCSKEEPKFWETIGPFMTEKSSISENISLKEGDEVIVDQTKICNIFNENFVHAARNIGRPQPVSLKDSLSDICNSYQEHLSIKLINDKMGSFCNNDKFRFKQITQYELNKKLLSLKTNKSCGYDRQPAKLLKLGASVLSFTLLPIINKSFLNSIFPSDLKYAEVAPVYKKGDSMCKTNFRPVSILVAQSKIFEGFMSEQMMSFLLDKLSPLLAAYRKGYSTQHVLMMAIEKWKLALDKDKYVGILLMDMSKAFDSMLHALMIAKLKAYGFSDEACVMIISYLSDRHQRVKIGTHRSEWSLLEKGVPQGSILGPDLFNVFVNDLFYCLENVCGIFNYADDNTLDKEGQTLEGALQGLQEAAYKSLDWFEHNEMQANASKFQFSMLTRRILDAVVTLDLNDVTLVSEDLVKLLGVKIDRNLTFHQHISDLCRRASFRLSALFRFQDMIDHDSKIVVFEAFIISNFLYCPIVWHFCGVTNRKKIEKIQENALRFIYKDYTSPYRDLLKLAKRDSMYVTHLRCIVSEIFKIINGTAPSFLNELFTKKEVKYDYRDNNILIVPEFKTITYGKNSLRYQGTKLWNSLDQEMKNVDSLDEFRKKVVTWKGPKCMCGVCLLCKCR